MGGEGTVMVVGGAGYIGSHAVLALEEAGFDVVVYDNYSTGHRNTGSSAPTVAGELDERQQLLACMKAFSVTSVLHFAALIEAGQSALEPLRFFRNNVAGTITLLEAMKMSGVSRIVFSSTAAVYGNVEAHLLGEDLPVAPINPYGQTKAMVEAILAAEASASGLQAMALRYFNAAGADPAGRTGERHDPETHLIPIALEAAMGRRPGLRIYGTDYDTPDGTCIRDYVHVSDLADGHVAALRRLIAQDRPGFAAVNLGTGLGHSVREVIDSVRAVTGRDVPVTECARRPGDAARLVAAPDKARTLLGWKARRTDLTTIVEDAWRFAQSRSERARPVRTPGTRAHQPSHV